MAVAKGCVFLWKFTVNGKDFYKKPRKNKDIQGKTKICKISPYFARVYRDNLKAKLSGWNLLTGLSSIKMNMICGERSSRGEERNAGRMLWSRWTDFEKLCINFLYR